MPGSKADTRPVAVNSNSTSSSSSLASTTPPLAPSSNLVSKPKHTSSKHQKAAPEISSSSSAKVAAPPRKTNSAPHDGDKTKHVTINATAPNRASIGATLAAANADRFRRKSLVEKSSKAYSQSVNEQDSTGLPSKEGHLRKENRHGRWQRRYFVTNNSHLNYFKHKHTHTLLGDHAKPNASIDLRMATHICVLARNGVPGKKFAIQTRAAGSDEEECYFLRAHTNGDAVAWVEALNARRAFYAGEDAKLSPEAEKIAEETAEYIRQDSGISTITDDLNGVRFYDPYTVSPPVSSPSEETIMDTADDYWLEGEDTDDDGFVSADEGTNGDHSSLDGDDDEDGHFTERSQSDSPSPSPKNKSCVVSESNAAAVANNPPSTLESKHWHVPEIRKLQVRSRDYLTTGQKQLADGALFHLVAVDNFLCEGRTDNIISHPKNRIAQAIKRGDKFPFMFVVNFQVPGPPFYSFVLYFAASEMLQHCLFDECSTLESWAKKGTEYAWATRSLPEGFPQLARKFFLGDNKEFRDERFKLIPRISEGPFIVRKSVGSKPAILGKKLTQRYFKGENVLELDLDVGSSTIAHRLLQLSLGYSKLLTVDMAFVLEGQDEKELPEQVVGLIRAVHVDFSKAVDINKGHL